MPAKRRPTRRPQQRPSRVQRCITTPALQDAISKAKKDGRMLYVIFTSTYNQCCMQMALFVQDLSRRREWSHILFAEVDIQKVPDAVQHFGVKGLPGVQCYKDGVCVENTVYATSHEVLTSLKTHGGEPPAPRQPMPAWVRMALQTVAVGAVAAAGWWLYASRPRLSGPEAELAQIDADIRRTQSNIHFLKRQRGKKKEVKAALLRLQELQDRRTAHLEAQQDAELEAPVAMGPHAGDDEASDEEWEAVAAA